MTACTAQPLAGSGQQESGKDVDASPSARDDWWVDHWHVDSLPENSQVVKQSPKAAGVAQMVPSTSDVDARGGATPTGKRRPAGAASVWVSGAGPRATP